MANIKVLLADSSTFTRILLSNAMESLGFDVVGVAKNGKEAMEKFEEYKPDITLVDLNLEGIDGIEVIRALTAQNPAAAVALLIPDNMDNPDVIVEAVRAGAKSYVKKPTSGDEVKNRLSNLLKGGVK